MSNRHISALNIILLQAGATGFAGVRTSAVVSRITYCLKVYMGV